MKRTILTALAALLLAVPAAQAQKVNKAGLISKIEKSDADIADAKKGAKASTWINRGKALYEAAAEPTKNLFPNMEVALLKLTVGEPQATEEVTLLDKPYTAWIYPYFTAYISDNKLIAWKQNEEVYPGAIRKAIEAYNKALEIDPKSAEKVKDGMQQISDYCSQLGNVGIDTGDYATSADAYATAFEAQSSPAYGKADPALLYYAGYLKTVEGAEKPEAFVAGADYLNKALDLGYADEEGSIYYYLFHCYYGQREKDPAFVMKAKDALLTGIEKFPKNERILDGLMQLYTTEKGVGDPADLVTMIEEAIQNSPDNVDLWFGRGRIFYALENYDESIASFMKVAELKPDMFEGNYFTGLFIVIKGDAMNEAINARQYTSPADYENDFKKLNEVYLEAIPWLEKAHELKPDDVNTVNYLKSLCYRFRDMEGMSAKYDKYDAIYKQMQQ